MELPILDKTMDNDALGIAAVTSHAEGRAKFERKARRRCGSTADFGGAIESAGTPK